jgi:hypothetical protein
MSADLDELLALLVLETAEPDGDAVEADYEGAFVPTVSDWAWLDRKLAREQRRLCESPGPVDLSAALLARARPRESRRRAGTASRRGPPSEDGSPSPDLARTLADVARGGGR